MIRYMLLCDNGHEFEGWFGSSADFDSQKARGLLICPNCGSQDVGKALMAPNVAPGRSGGERSEVGDPGLPRELALPDERMRALAGKIRDLRKAIMANTEDVGKNFAEEARKIHYGETKERGIRGQANAEDAVGLLDEGIAVMPIPGLPEDKN